MGAASRTDKMTHLYVYHLLATFWTRDRFRHIHTRKNMNLTMNDLNVN